MLNPDPYFKVITLQIVSQFDANYIITLLDKKGKFLKVGAVDLSYGINRIVLKDMHYLPSGFYYLHVNDTNGTSIYRSQLIKH